MSIFLTIKKKYNLVKNFLFDKDKKKTSVLITEIFTLWKKNRSFPHHYFSRFAYRKDAGFFKDYVDFVTIKKLWQSQLLHSPDTFNILKDKVEFNRVCKLNDIPTALLYAFSKGAYFFDPTQPVKIDRIDEFNDFFLTNIFKKNNVKRIFAKPVYGRQGKGCFIVDMDEFKDINKVQEYFNIFKKEDYLFEELLLQNEQLSLINPYSINTIRVDTFIDGHNRVHILSALMRIGRKGSVVDNATAGGFFVPVNIENWTLGEYGIQFLEISTKLTYVHPDTKFKLEGFKIPYGNEIIEIVSKLALAVGDRFTGWDVAITKNGPVVIEGNLEHHIGLQDSLYKGYKKHPIFKEIIKQYT